MEGKIIRGGYPRRLSLLDHDSVESVHLKPPACFKVLSHGGLHPGGGRGGPMEQFVHDVFRQFNSLGCCHRSDLLHHCSGQCLGLWTSDQDVDLAPDQGVQGIESSIPAELPPQGRLNVGGNLDGETGFPEGLLQAFPPFADSTGELAKDDPAFSRMHDNRLSGLPVVDDRYHVVGYINLLELMAACFRQEGRKLVDPVVTL